MGVMSVLLLFARRIFLFCFLLIAARAATPFSDQVDFSLSSPLPGSSIVTALKALPDGSVLLAWRGGGAAMSKLQHDGQIVPEFQGPSSVENFEIDELGNLVVLGYFPFEPFSIQRFHLDSTRDTSFKYPSFREGSLARSMALQSHGKILICGSFATDTQTNQILRLNRDGSIDPTWIDPFPNRGFSPGVTALIKLLLVDRHQRVYLMEGETGRSLTRLHPNGTIDETFNFPELRLTIGGEFSLVAYPSVVRIDSHDRILAFGYFNYVNSQFNLDYHIRVTYSGTIVPGLKPVFFNPTRAQHQNLSDVVLLNDHEMIIAEGGSRIAVAADGKVYISENSSSSRPPFLKRYLGFYQPSKPPVLQIQKASNGFNLFLAGGTNSTLRLESAESVTQWQAFREITNYNGFFSFSISHAGKANYFRARVMHYAGLGESVQRGQVRQNPKSAIER